MVQKAREFQQQLALSNINCGAIHLDKNKGGVRMCHANCVRTAFILLNIWLVIFNIYLFIYFLIAYKIVWAAPRKSKVCGSKALMPAIQDNSSSHHRGTYRAPMVIPQRCIWFSVTDASNLHRQPFEEENVQCGHKRSDSSDKVKRDNKTVFDMWGQKKGIEQKVLFGCRQKYPSTRP